MLPKLNILIAYPYLKKESIDIIKETDAIRFVLDSGAFTAWKAGKPIALDDYCKFIEQLPFKPWRYFNLDVIGDGDKSMRNYEIMLKRGFTPVPIFTRGEDIQAIDEYYKTSDVVGIGGLVKTKGNMGFVKGIMEVVGDRKVHLLGFVRHQYINYYKPYMCDASSWSYGSRVGDFKVYMGKGVIKSYRKKDFINKPDKEILKLLETYDISAQMVKSKDFWSNGKQLTCYAGRMWVRRSLETEKIIKTKLFLAVGSHQTINILLESYNKEIKRFKEKK
jgi:hypothetical protein